MMYILINNEDIIKEFAERIKSQLLKNNNKMQLYEVDKKFQTSML